MDLYSSFPGSAEFLMRPAEFHVVDKPFGEASWLRLKLELLLTYRSVPKPPELTTMCMICSSISRGIDSGTLTVDDFVVEWRTLEDKYVSRNDHFWSATIQQLIELTSSGYCYECLMLLVFGELRVLVPHIAGCFVALLSVLVDAKPVRELLCITLVYKRIQHGDCPFDQVLHETHKILLQRYASSTSVPRQGEITVMFLDWLSQRYQIMLIHLSPTQVYEGVQFLYKEEVKPVAVTLYWKSEVAEALLNNTVLALLLHGDGSIVGQEHVDTYGRLSTFDFGSLTRPQEAHCIFSFKSLKFTSMFLSLRRLWRYTQSYSCPRCKSITSRGGVLDI